MAPINRRLFFRSCAAAGLAAGVTPLTRVGWTDLALAANERPLPADAGVLVIITLGGGNDGLNTLIPYTDDTYFDSRPDLAIAPEDVLTLDSDLGLNPVMKGFSKLYQKQSLAIVRGVGYPEPDRSHFRSMDIWQTASLDSSTTTGWIGRWLESTGGDPLQALNVGPLLPRLAVGEKISAASLSPDVVPAGNIGEVVRMLSTADEEDTAAMAPVRSLYRDAIRLAENLDPVFPTESASEEADLAELGLIEQLDAVARCVKAGVPSRVYTVTLGGFDTHANERGAHQRLLKTLDTAVTQFYDNVATDGRGRNVVVMMYSEFGRRVKANASDGTDHGTAGPVFIVGDRVRGGFYGDEPSLRDLSDGDLKTTTDFRDIYHEVLARTLGADPEPVLGSGRQELGFLSA